MNALIVVLLVVILLVLVAILIAITRNRRHAVRVAKAPTLTDPFRDTDTDAIRGDPRRIKPGDIVEIRGRTYAVRGTLRFTEGSWSWSEHLLDDPEGHRRWLSVEEDPDLILVLWSEVSGATVKPGPATVEFDGRRYTSQEEGTARYEATGTTGLNPIGTVQYHDYRAADGARLSFEKYGDSNRWEVARGEELTRYELRVYPASTP